MIPKGALARWSGRLTGWLAAFVCCGVAALAWFGYRAADEWQRSSALLVERRTNEIADMLSTALTRDMRAVQVSILESRAWDGTSLESPYEINDLVAGAFARYPYPEVFFAWRDAHEASVFFARADRLPPWLPFAGGGDRYPVTTLANAQVSSLLATRISRDTGARRQYSIFDITIDGIPYQVIARPLYRDLARRQPDGVFGFMVNMDWVRANYFSSLTLQVTRIAGAADGVDTTIVDDGGRTIPGLAAARSGQAPTKRSFPVLFFDPTIIAMDPPPDLARRAWSVEASASGDPTLAIAAQGARRTMLVVAAGAFALGLGLLITVRGARASADIASMRADFVSTVTHELKTPVQVIRGIGETLIRGRVGTPERLREYAQLLVQEGYRLSRLIDNLLAYARVTDAADVYTFEPQRPAEVIDEAIRGFHRLLSESGFNVTVDVPATLPSIRADRTAIILALDNLIDNAMRYSGDGRQLAVSAQASHGVVDFSVVDHGKGIPTEDLERVQRRFVRGRSTNGHGSGLGLAIVNRIATDHGGQFQLHSQVNGGTTAILRIPTASP